MSKSTFSLLIFTVFFLCIYFTAITVKYPHIGIKVEETKNKQYEIINVFPQGAAEHVGIKEGDIILNIDGDTPEKHESVKKYNLVEQVHDIVIERNGDILKYDLQSRFYRDQFLLHIVFPFFILILSILFSAFLFKYKRNEKVAIILVVLFQLYGIGFFAGAASARTEPLAQFFAISTLLLMPLLLFHFFFLYFQKYNLKFASFHLIKKLYIANFFMLIISLLFLFLPLNNILYSVIRTLTLFMFFINVCSCLYFFGRSFLKYRKSIYSSLFKIIIVGIFISFLPFTLLYAIPTIIFKQEFISGEVSFLFTCFLPLTFVYLVSTNRFFDINFYIKRIFYYALLALAPSLLLVIMGAVAIHEVSVQKWLQLFVVVYLFFIIVFYIKEELDYRFRSNLFAEKYNLQSSIYQFVAFLSREKSRKVVEQYFVNEIKAVLGLKNIALLEYDKETDNLGLVNGNKWGYDFELLHEQLIQYNGKYFFGELQSLNTDSYLIVAENTKKILVLVFGEKRNFTAFNHEEKEWLKTISYFMNVSYQNLQMIDDLIGELETMKIEGNAPSWMLKMLFHIEERERKRLSIDLHDSALQAQLVLYRELSEILEKYNFEASIKQELAWVNEGLLDVIHEIRETCNELMPPFLKETGIVGALENLFKKLQLRTNVVIDFNAASNFTISLEDEMTLTLYRIAQELMNNAEKHSNASKVSFYLTSEFNHIILKYKDNGEGLAEDKVTTFNGRLGIYGIKERVRSVDGKIEFRNSSDDKGLEIIIEIPLEKENKVLVGQ
ncbi:MAG TPA: PDZ domain-containing protein [Bacillus bacterium]|nr:PDZ domain-containing protein [Bacillus sp. (in: firmicutes)]